MRMRGPAPAAYTSSTSWNLNDSTYGGMESDGIKSIYVKYKDKAGNWSIIYSDAIVLDMTAPTGAVHVNANAANTTDPGVTLTALCSDATSGCGQMRFSNDNATWSTPVSFGASTTWDLVSGHGGTATDGNKRVYAQFQDNAGGAWSASVYDDIFLDNHAPVTTASPGSGSQQNSVGVTLTCNDGSGSGCNKTYYTTDGTTPTTFSSIYSGGTITLAGTQSPMYLKFFSVDMLGNAESVKTETYTFFAATTKLSILLSSQTIKQTDSVDVSGSLSQLSTASIDLSDLPISLIITGPTGTTTLLQHDRQRERPLYLPRYRHSFSQKGTYGIKASLRRHRSAPAS